MKLINYSILSSFLLLAGNSHAAFIDSYDFSKWTPSTMNGGSITSTLNDSVTLISSNDDSEDPQEVETNQDLTIAILADGSVSFHWQYSTNDISSSYDPFGYLLNDTFTELTNNDKDNADQQGDFSIAVYKDSVFGFRIHSQDSLYGAATAVVNDFSAPTAAPVPLPAALWLFGTGLFGLLWQAKRRQVEVPS